MSYRLNGISASDGIAFGQAFKLVMPDLSFQELNITDSDKERERFYTSLQSAEHEIQQIRKQTTNVQGEKNAAIFDAHLLILKDPEFISLIKESITKEKMNA